MTNKFFKITAASLLLSCFIFSCNQSESYILTKQANLRIIEREDHQKCIDQGIGLGDWGDVINELYWRCRYNMAQTRMIIGDNSGSNNTNNAQVKKLSGLILANLNRSRQIVLSRIEGNINVADHAKCVSMGFNLDSSNDDEIEQYYKCRENLVLYRIPPAPKITHLYEVSILPDDKAAQYLANIAASQIENPKVVEANNMIDTYPLCSGLNYKSDEFTTCASAQEDSRKCLKNIRIEVAKKNVDDKIYCQQQAFIQFPDDYAIVKDKSYAQIKREKEKRKKEEEKIAKENEDEIKKNMTLKFLQEGGDAIDSSERKTKISTPKDQNLTRYSKIELLKLREQFIERCDKSMEGKIPQFINEATNSCMKIATGWDK